jgi:hypothetical protein
MTEKARIREAVRIGKKLGMSSRAQVRLAAIAMEPEQEARSARRVRNVSVREARPQAPARNATPQEKRAFMRGVGDAGPSREERVIEKIRAVVREATGAGAIEPNGVPSKDASAEDKLNYLRPY